MSRATYEPAASGSGPANLFIQRKCACGAQAQAISGECEQCQRERVLGVQPKLVVGGLDDPLEHEADRIASAVMRDDFDGLSSASRDGTAVRRSALTRGDRFAPAPAPALVHDVIASQGHPLDTPLRTAFEKRFKHDFSRVRIHSGSLADASAKAVGARAYTVGNHVVFSAGQYAPDSLGGRTLLAHELAHVIQQGKGALRLQRAPAGGCGVCQLPMHAGTDAHKWIGGAFVADGGMSELRVYRRRRGRGQSGRLDLAAIDPKRRIIKTGEVKPDNQSGIAAGIKDQHFYRDIIANDPRYGDYFHYHLRSSDWPAVGPVGYLVTKGMPKRCGQVVHVRPSAHGLWLYSCSPPASVIEARPDCACKKKKKKKAKRNSRRTSSNKPRPTSQRQAERIARRTERQVERTLRKEVAERGARRAIARQVGKVAGRIALRAVPVVGWVLLAIDVAEATYGLYNLIKYGPGEGGEGGGKSGEAGEKSGAGDSSDDAGSAQNAHGYADTADETGNSEGKAGEGGEHGEGGDSRSGTERDGDGTRSNGQSKHPDIDPELARLGIFDTVEQAEAYAETLPLSETLLTALKESSPEQQQLLEQMLADSSDGTLPKVDEAFLLRMLEITRDMSVEELATLSAALVPVSGQTLEEVLKRYEDAIKAIRAGKTLDGTEAPTDKPAEPSEQRPRTSELDSTDKPADNPPAGSTAAKPSQADVAKGKGNGGKGDQAVGKGREGKASGDRAGKSAAKGETDRATAPPAGTTSTPSGVFGFLILSGMSPASTLTKGQSLSCTLRIADVSTGREFTLTNVDLTFEGRRDERVTVDGVEYIDTTFTVHFTGDFWSEKNNFHGLGGKGSATEYRFPRRKVTP